MKNLWRKLKKYRLTYVIAGITVAASLSGCSTKEFTKDLADFIYDSPWVALGLFFLVFFIVREISCWYYKSNEILEKINDVQSKLEKIEEQLQELKKITDQASVHEKD